MGNLYPKFKDKKCKAFVRDWRVQCKHNYYYPDVVIDCDSTRNENQAGQPVVIFEVLSESIRAVDLTIKLNDYRQIHTLEAYILVEQNLRAVTIYRSEDNWKAETFVQADDVITLPCVDTTLSLADIYADVALEIPKKPFRQPENPI
ncbi:Uma2 family endonuclease [Kingella negevensis]|uniref:Uma2 family endonuclease n=1 Tax=Kingella negevensis TaxID=1522312 RepID=UPI002543633B|nr:Uma2 family endonuclease [Kingella negevensis]WII92393.1 Uma2 family endonuclease [Kingella negevensis]